MSPAHKQWLRILAEGAAGGRGRAGPRSTALAALLLLVTAGPSSGQVSDLGDQLEVEVLRAMASFRVPGVAVAVVSADSLRFAGGWGLRAVGEVDSVNAETIFAIGSTGKAFTTAALGMAVDEGLLDWDDPVQQHLPWFQLADPYRTRYTTVRDLITHRTGLPGADEMWYGASADRRVLVERLRFLVPTAGFRAKYQYQNLMFVAAGEVLGAVYGQSWDDVVRERILEPFAMTSTSTTISGLLGAGSNVALPHVMQDDDVLTVPFRWIDHVGPAGSLNSNVLDMARWLRFHLGGGTLDGDRWLRAETLDAMYQPNILKGAGQEDGFGGPAQFLTYGLGWQLQDFRGHKLIWHWGGIDGMTCFVGLLPEEDIGVVVLTNLNGSVLMDAVGYTALELFLDGETSRDWIGANFRVQQQAEQDLWESLDAPGQPRLEGTARSLPRGAYVGSYINPLYDPVYAQLTDTGLRLSWGRKESVELSHWHGDTFRGLFPIPPHLGRQLAGPRYVTFELTPDGEVAGMRISGWGGFRKDSDPGRE